jgi:methylated-DNA-protein-cysteine methyltransferase-like protein
VILGGELSLVESHSLGHLGGEVHVPLLMTLFEDAVRSVVADLQPGEIVSYGWVACQAGYGGRARSVGQFLSKNSKELPWWRVVYCTGDLAQPRARQQAAKLKLRDGVRTIRGRVVADVSHIRASDCPGQSGVGITG